VGADHAGKAAEQLGHGQAEDQAVEGEEEAEAIDLRPRGPLRGRKLSGRETKSKGWN